MPLPTYTRNQFFTTVDAKYWYWQTPLDEVSQHLTTFITPWGRYKFLRAPMGLSSTGDEYCIRHDIAIPNHTNMQKVMDDVIMLDESFDNHYNNQKLFRTIPKKQNLIEQRKILIRWRRCRLCGLFKKRRSWTITHSTPGNRSHKEKRQTNRILARYK